MHYKVEVSATFVLHLDARDAEQAASRGDREIARVCQLIARFSQSGSPLYCTSFYTNLSGSTAVTLVQPDKPKPKL